MDKGLSREEDTALRCLAALADAGTLSDEHQELMDGLRVRDRRTRIRRTGTKVVRASADQPDVPTTTG